MYFISILSGPIAQTSSGRVQGKIAPLNDPSEYAYAFMGIPYAAPPVGDLRFKPPQPAKSWKGIRDATKPGTPNITFDGSENYLLK